MGRNWLALVSAGMMAAAAIALYFWLWPAGMEAAKLIEPLDMGNSVMLSLGYLAMFFAGGFGLAVFGHMNKRQGGNDLACTERKRRR